MNPPFSLAGRTANMRPSEIREIMKKTVRPGMISLAGGVPANETLPMAHMTDLFSSVLEKYGERALQYGPSEGFVPLRASVAKHLNRQNFNIQPEDVLIFSGAQSVLDIAGKILIDTNDVIAIEEPTYLGAMSAFGPYQPIYAGIQTDEFGIIPDALEQVLQERDVKLIYLTPTFQNPTGRTLSLDRRKAVAQLLVKYGALVLEDDPYSDLRYSGAHLPSLWSLAPNNVIYTSSFSKIFSPGLRTGFAIVPEPLRRWFVVAKQGVDLHTSSLSQALAAEFLDAGLFEQQLPVILSTYKPRLDALLSGIKDHFPNSYRWTKPEGGMFVWLECEENIDATAVCLDAYENNAAPLPGKFFYVTKGAGETTMRLSFTSRSEDELYQATEIVAKSIDRVRSEICS